MARIETGAPSTGKRAVLHRAITPGDTPRMEIVVDGVPAGETITRAWLTIKALEADADPGVLQLAVTSVAGAAGHVTDTGGDGVGALAFTPTAVQTALLTGASGVSGAPYHYDVQVGLSNGKTYTVERGFLRPWYPPVNAWEGSRGAHGLIRSPLPEPVDGQPFPYENELLDNLVAGDDYSFRRFVYGLAAGRTVASARFTARSASAQADPGLFQISITNVAGAGGRVEDVGSGAPRRADIRFEFTRVQTALLAVARAFDIEVTLDNGEIHTVMRGTLYARTQVTLAEPSGGPAWVTANLEHMWHPSAGAGQVLADTADAAGGNVDQTFGSTDGADSNDPTWGSNPQHIRGAVDDYTENRAAAGSVRINNAAYTYEALIYIEGVRADIAIPYITGWGSSRSNDYNYEAGLNFYADGVIRWLHLDAVELKVVLANPNSFVTNEWMHMVVTYNGTIIRLYKNKVEIASLAAGHLATSGNDKRHMTGRLTGLVNHFGPNPWRFGTQRIYSAALSQVQIDQNYDDRKTIYTTLP